MDNLLCLDAIPNLWGYFDTTIAPPLLYYSYIPIIIISLIFSGFVFMSNRGIYGRSLMVISTFFSLLLVNEIVQWIAADGHIVHFGWQMSALLQMAVIMSVVYFVWIYLKRSDLSFHEWLWLIIPVVPVVVLLPTTLNMASFDLIECQSLNGPLWNYIYLIEAYAIVFIGYLVFSHRRIDRDKSHKKQGLFLGLAAIFFLSIFVATNIIGDATFIYEFNLWGPLGMLIFIAILGYLIVEFRLFNVRILGAQGLVFGLLALIFALLFVEQIEYVRSLTALTLIFGIILGIILVRGVKREVAQREHIEKLAGDLKKVNIRLTELDRQKSEFVSFATHQLRSPLAAMKGYASLILEGDMGTLPGEARDAVSRIYDSTNTLTSIVDDYLNIARIELGSMKYAFETVDLKTLIEDVIAELKPNISKATGLTFSFHAQNSGTDYRVTADRDKIKQVVYNLIDNSLKYTPHGSVIADLSFDRIKHKFVFAVKDTGIGIAPETLPHLFNKWSRAHNANKTNIKGTGLGLFVAREILTAHCGTIRAESVGEGKGSTFIVELEPFAKA
jgi:signal transduction histidine kinase